MEHNNNNSNVEPHYFLSTHDFELIKIIFETVAQENEGTKFISVQTAEALLARFGLPQNLKELVSEEFDGSLNISLEKFCRFFHFSQLKQAFSEIDEDHSGKIDSVELLHALDKLGYKRNTLQCQKMMESIDENGDGKVSFEEFRKYFEHVPVSSFTDVVESWRGSLAEKNVKRLAFVFLEAQLKSSVLHTINTSQTQEAFGKLGLDIEVNELITLKKNFLGEVNDDNNLKFPQFCRLFHLARLKIAFDDLDQDGSGAIDENELSSALKTIGYSLTPTHCKTMIQDADIKGDGVVSFEEFLVFFENTPVENLQEIIDSWADSSFNLFGGQSVMVSGIFPSPGLKLWQIILTAGLAGVLSRTLTAPLDVIQTMQASGTTSTMISSFQKIFSQAGLRGFLAGNGIHCLCIFPRAGITATLNGKLLSFTPVDKHGKSEPIYRAICAGTASFFATILTYPLLLLHTRRIVYQQKYKRVTDLVESIIFKEGVAGFYHGLSATLFELVPLLAIQITLIEMGKQKAVENNLQPTAPLVFAVGAFAGIAAQTVVYPLTVIRTRMQLEVDDMKRYNGIPTNMHRYNYTTDWYSSHAFLENIWRRKGMRGLYSGIAPTYLRVIPGAGIGSAVFHALKEHFLDINNRERGPLFKLHNSNN